MLDAWRKTQKRIFRKTSLSKYNLRKSGEACFLQPLSDLQLWEQIQEIFWRDKPHMSPKKIWQDTSLKLILKDKGVVIDSIFVYLDLRVETFFEKECAGENGGLNFEIVDIGTSALVYWKLKKVSCKTCLLCFFTFFSYKKIFQKLSWPVLKLYQWICVWNLYQNLITALLILAVCNVLF